MDLEKCSDLVQIGKKIGKGGWSDVFEGIYKGKPVAVKLFHPGLSTPRHTVNAKAEIDVPKFLIDTLGVDCDVIKPVNYFECKGERNRRRLMVLLERIDGIDLLDFINNLVEKGKEMEDTVKWDLTIKLLKAVECINSHGVYHLDLKPDNIMLRNEGGEINVTLIDFGLSCITTSKEKELDCEKGKGVQPSTPLFNPPEFMPEDYGYKGRSYKTKEAYNLGVVLYILWYGEFPIDDDDRHSYFTDRIYPETLRNINPQGIKMKILRGLLEQNPLRRLTISQALDMAASRTLSKNEILMRIKVEFDKLHAKYGEPPIHKLEDTTPEMITHDLGIWGIFIVGDAVSKEAFVTNKKQNIRELSLHLFGNEDPFADPEFSEEYKRIEKKYADFPPEEKILATMIAGWWKAKEGFGNMNFRFLYFQFLKENPAFEVGGERIEFSRNPYHRHNIRLLADKPKLWRLLKSLHTSEVPMVSWDSQKVRFHDAGVVTLSDGTKIGLSKNKARRGGKPGLTKRHRDVYNYGGNEMDRIQAMVIQQSPDAVSLGWVIFSNQPKIQKLISQYFGKKPGGFSSVEDEKLNPILDLWWRGPKGGFVIWNQPTIHYEAVADPVSRKFVSFSQPQKNLREFSFRAVIGTHTPVELTTKDLYRLAFLSEKGYAPAIYCRRNKGTRVNKNVVNPKSTQYMIPRSPREKELEELEEARENYDESTIHKFVDGLPKIIREMYGIYNIPFSAIAEKRGIKDVEGVERCVRETARIHDISIAQTIEKLK